MEYPGHVEPQQVSIDRLTPVPAGPWARGRTATAATLRRGKEGNRRFDLVRQYELMVFEATCPRIFDQFLLDKAAGRSTGLRCIYFNLRSNSRPSLCKKGCTKTRSKAKAPWGQMWLPGTIMVEKAETSPDPTHILPKVILLR